MITLATGAVTTIAGATKVAGVVDGSATAARFFGPWGIATDGKRLFVGDSRGATIRVVE